MKLSKYERETIILFNEEESYAEVYTYNQEVKKRLRFIARHFPDECKFKGTNGFGGHFFAISKRLVHFSLPKSEEWREQIRRGAVEENRMPPDRSKME